MNQRWLIAGFMILLCTMQTYTYADTLEILSDSISKDMLLDEVVITSNLKTPQRTAEIPGSVSVFNAQTIARENIHSVKDLSTIAPNIFIPNYGSRLTTAIYIRGIGSRTNNSPVGIYVDNIPFMDKSSFDFNLLDLERIEILRGPQSTLYGRNTMAGLINIYTQSPFEHQYIKASVSYGNYNALRVSLSRYGKINENLAYSLCGQYQRGDGYLTNYYSNTQADSTRSFHSRMQLSWRPMTQTKLTLSSHFEYSWQGGYPYRMMDEATGKMAPVYYNDPSSYNRTLSTTSLLVESRLGALTLTNATGYQFINDRMNMDQDYTEKSIFTLNQKQRQQSVSNELIIKSSQQHHFKWLVGAFGFYQSMHTNAPVTFKHDGIQGMINDTIKKYVKPYGPILAMTDTLTNNEMVIEGDFKTPTWGTALFTQLTFDNLLTEGFSFSAGARIDYEKARLSYNSYTTAQAHTRFQLPPNMGNINIDKNDDIFIQEKGDLKSDNWEILPKFDIRYVNNDYMVYGSVAKGYRAGGFNFQMFSDIIRGRLQSRMIQQFISNLQNGVPPSMTAMIDKMMPESVLQMAQEPNYNISNYITYKPEHSWNYEIGIRTQFFEKRLSAEMSAFYINVRDQQITAFTEDGLGRMTKNSGKSKSMGIETAFRFTPSNRLILTANYGFTHARFVDYSEQKKVGNEIISFDYHGNHIPFAPVNTFAISGNYLLPLKGCWIEHLNFFTHFAASGRTYWTDDNSQYQNLYGTLDAKISIHKGKCELSLWGKNLTDSQYKTFYFESLGKRLAQTGNPLTFGTGLSVRF